jgi:DNA-binding transcriptional MerR regulator
MSGWIKIHRKFLEWEWFNKSEAVHLFMYMLLKANHKDGKWQGIEVKRGQFISSLGNISNATGISVQTIRTILKKLEKTNEIELKSTSQFTIVTISKYDCYQEQTDETNKPLTNNQQATNKQLTTNKNDKKENNNTIPEFSEFLAYALEKKPKINQQDLRLKYDSWKEGDWSTNRNGKLQPITNWKTTLLNTLPYLKEINFANASYGLTNDWDG